MDYSGRFTDGNGQTVWKGYCVEYRFGERRGIVFEILQDGDARVWFSDTNQFEWVKWCHLCKIGSFIRRNPPMEPCGHSLLVIDDPESGIGVCAKCREKIAVPKPYLPQWKDHLIEVRAEMTVATEPIGDIDWLSLNKEFS